VPRRRISAVLLLRLRASHLYIRRDIIYTRRADHPPARRPATPTVAAAAAAYPPKVKIYGPEGIIRVSESSTANYYDITLRNRYYMVTGLSRAHAQPRRSTPAPPGRARLRSRRPFPLVPVGRRRRRRR